MSVRASTFAFLALAAGAVASTACTKTVRETAVTVLTLQDGSMSCIRARRGTGPFREYPVPPDEMRKIVASVLKTKVVAVFDSPARSEVAAKERECKLATEDTYSEAWLSAVVVFVHPVPGDDTSSKIEIHAAVKGPGHTGRIRWEVDLPPLIDDAVAHRGTTPIRPLR